MIHDTMRRPRIGQLFTVIIALTACGDTADDGRISEFGRYEGYSEPRFDEWVKTSQYLEMRDGVKLAIDVVRPAVNGEPVDERFPVIWTHSRYHRSLRNSSVDPQPVLQRLVRHGYVYAAVGVRGSGASYGRYEGLFSPNETRDAYEIIDWLANQPWSDGNVGMYGGSYLGITQYMAASQQHPALKAIFPNVAVFDMYDLLYPGGVYRDDQDPFHFRNDTSHREIPVETSADRLRVSHFGYDIRDAARDPVSVSRARAPQGALSPRARRQSCWRISPGGALGRRSTRSPGPTGRPEASSRTRTAQSPSRGDPGNP